MLLRIFETAFPVREGERRLTLLLFLQNVFTVGAFVAGRSVRDALFLARVDRDALAWMYVASALAVAVVGAAYAPLAARFRRDRLALGSALFFAAGFVGLWFAARSGGARVFEFLYVYVEVMGALTVVQFWTLSNELFHAREARRLYGLIGAGGMLSNVAIGLLTARVATAFGATALLWLCALLLLGCAVSSFLAGRLGRQRIFARTATRRTTPRTRMSGGASRVFSSGHLRAVAALTVVTFFTTSLVDYQFKVVAADTFQQDQLAAFFGYLYSGVGVLAFGLQLFGTGRILARAGVIGALLILPAALGGGSLLFALVPTIAAAAMLKGADALFRYSVNDATSQILYLPVAPSGRASAKAFIDGVVKPASIGVAGILLVGYGGWLGGDPRNLAWLSLALCVGWLGLVVALRPKYLRSLQDNLRSRRLDLESEPYRVRDGATNRVLTRALESGDPREVLNALELLPHLEDVELDDRVEALLDHELPAIRVASLEYYKRRQSVRYANSIFRRFDDPDPSVRAAAIDAFCSMGKDKAVKSVRQYLADPDPAVRGAAVTGMIRYGGLDGVLMAAEALKQLIAHAQPEMRVHAARVLGAVGVSNFYQPVLELMSDPDPRVRREAIHAAGILRSPEFVAPLVYKTRSPDTGREAIEALTLYGPSIARTLGKVLANPLEASAIRRAMSKVLGRLGTPEAVEMICRALDEKDEDLRAQLYRSLARAVKGKRFMPVDRKAVMTALDREFLRAYQVMYAADVLELGPGPGRYTPMKGPAAAAALLASALDEEIAATERRIFMLLSVLYPEAEMERIYAGLRDATAHDAPRRRANAVELLDNLLDRELKRKLLPLLEELRRDQRLRAAMEVLPLRKLTHDDALTELCRDGTSWVRACAIHFAYVNGAAITQEVVLDAVSDQSAVVRETALLGAVQANTARVTQIAETHLTDEAPVVRRQAARIAARRA